MDDVSRLVATKLAGFLRTLRENAFAVGLREGQDAAALIVAGYAARPGLLRSAFKHLFSARKSDWEKFDGLFDAFWLGKRVKSRSLTTGSAKAANSPSLKGLQDNHPERTGVAAATDQIPSADDAPDPGQLLHRLGVHLDQVVEGGADLPHEGGATLRQSHREIAVLGGPQRPKRVVCGCGVRRGRTRRHQW